MNEKLRVRVELVLDVDADEWSGEYGVEGRNNIRADVREYVRTLMHNVNTAIELAE